MPLPKPSPVPLSAHQLFTHLWVVGIFASLVWSPFLVVGALERAKLAHSGLEAMGKVTSHLKSRRSNTDFFTAVVRYEVKGSERWVQIHGNGASDQRLPIGSEVTVRYLPSKPDYSQVDVRGASSSRGPGWVCVLTIWGLALAGMIGAYFTRVEKRAPFKPSAKGQ